MGDAWQPGTVTERVYTACEGACLAQCAGTAHGEHRQTAAWAPIAPVMQRPPACRRSCTDAWQPCTGGTELRIQCMHARKCRKHAHPPAPQQNPAKLMGPGPASCMGACMAKPNRKKPSPQCAGECTHAANGRMPHHRTAATEWFELRSCAHVM